MAHEVKSKLRDILLWINIGKMANIYFNKNSSWLYDKIDERNTEFTQEEIQQLKGSLVDLADRIRKCADSDTIYHKIVGSYSLSKPKAVQEAMHDLTKYNRQEWKYKHNKQ